MNTCVGIWLARDGRNNRTGQGQGVASDWVRIPRPAPSRGHTGIDRLARRGARGGGGFLFSATPGTGGSSYLRAARRLRARDGRPAGSPQNELIIKL